MSKHKEINKHEKAILNGMYFNILKSLLQYLSLKLNQFIILY